MLTGNSAVGGWHLERASPWGTTPVGSSAVGSHAVGERYLEREGENGSWQRDGSAEWGDGESAVGGGADGCENFRWKIRGSDGAAMALVS